MLNAQASLYLAACLRLAGCAQVVTWIRSTTSLRLVKITRRLS